MSKSSRAVEDRAKDLLREDLGLNFVSAMVHFRLLTFKKGNNDYLTG